MVRESISRGSSGLAGSVGRGPAGRGPERVVLGARGDRARLEDDVAAHPRAVISGPIGKNRLVGPHLGKGTRGAAIVDVVRATLHRAAEIERPPLAGRPFFIIREKGATRAGLVPFGRIGMLSRADVVVEDDEVCGA